MERDGRIPSGSWFGHVSFGSPELGGGASPLRLGLEIAGGRLGGGGEDPSGPFSLDGAAESDGRVRWTLRYEGGAAHGTRIAFLGQWDAAAAELSGRWRLMDDIQAGTFAIKPGDAQDLVDEETVRSVLQSVSRWQDQVRFDLEAVRFDGERAMLDLLSQDEAFVAAVRGAKALEQVTSFEPSGAELRLFPRVAVGPRTLPIAFRALDRCREVLGLTAPVDLFVENNGSINACVGTSRDGRIQITFTSAVINHLDADEITAITGHELGHALLGHLETRVASDERLSGVTQLRRLALARYQELSADRVGLCCLGDLDKVLRTEFMLHSGVWSRDRIGSAEQIEETAQQAVARGEGRAESSGVGSASYDTHPCGAFRTLALAWFGRSAPYHALRGEAAPAGVLSEAELEAKVSELVAAMNPAVLDAVVCDVEIDELVALTALAVAGADEQTTQAEVRAIRELSPGVSAAYDRVLAMPVEERQLRTLDLADKLVLTLPPLARERLVEDLVMLAQADGELSDSELRVLDGIGVLLQAGPGLAGGLLSELQGGLD